MLLFILRKAILQPLSPSPGLSENLSISYFQVSAFLLRHTNDKGDWEFPIMVASGFPEEGSVWRVSSHGCFFFWTVSCELTGSLLPPTQACLVMEEENPMAQASLTKDLSSPRKQHQLQSLMPRPAQPSSEHSPKAFLWLNKSSETVLKLV
jgi:hypothetical protein